MIKLKRKQQIYTVGIENKLKIACKHTVDMIF